MTTPLVGTRATTPSHEHAASGLRHSRTRPGFFSILFDRDDPDLAVHGVEPDYFADLQLGEIVGSVASGRDAYDLKPFFHHRLRDTSTIAYRHEVFQDLEAPSVIGIMRAFARDMLAVRTRLANAAKSYYRYEQRRWFLDAADAYTRAVTDLQRELAAAAIRSTALRAFREYLGRHVTADGFGSLAADTEHLEAALAAVRYRLRITGGDVVVGHLDDEPDYSAEVLATFEKFRQGDGKSYTFKVPSWPDMNHVENAIVERVALLFPDVFAALDRYCEMHRDFLDPTLERIDREAQFYLAYLEHMARLKSAGLTFCYPVVTPGSTKIRGHAVFDLALARLLIDDGRTVVTNDFELQDDERVIVVSGPNQGGKTTFARTIGQLHHLAAIGVPVPGSAARLHLVDQIFTHFERVEDVDDLTSKLESDLRRMRTILSGATSHSLLVMNESFSSTTIDDQLIINTAVLRTIIDRGLLGVVVTFLDELASLDRATISMVSTVDPDEPARRTFKILRRPADGLAYAMAIAEKHRVTYPQVKVRLAS